MKQSWKNAAKVISVLAAVFIASVLMTNIRQLSKAGFRKTDFLAGQGGAVLTGMEREGDGYRVTSSEAKIVYTFPERLFLENLRIGAAEEGNGITAFLLRASAESGDTVTQNVIFSDGTNIFRMNGFFTSVSLEFDGMEGSLITLREVSANRLMLCNEPYVVPGIVLSVGFLLTFLCFRLQRWAASGVPKEKKKRIYEMDFIRALCAAGIVFFHYLCALPLDCSRLYAYGCIDLGSVLVAAFFIISGAALVYNYGELRSFRELVSFYVKRFLGMMPMFYILFCWRYLHAVIPGENFFYGGSIKHLLPTLCGMDGYLNELFGTYYQLGEWFMGAIIILYILYPLLLLTLRSKKIFFPAAVIIFAGSILSLQYIPVPLTSFTRIPCCILPFFFGMAAAKYRLLGRKPMAVTGGIAALLMLILKYVSVPQGVVLKNEFAGVLLFAALYLTGSVVMKNMSAGKIVSHFSGLSFAVFLTHHYLVMWIAPMETTVFSAVTGFGLVCIIITASAELLVYANNFLTSKVKALAEKCGAA